MFLKVLIFLLIFSIGANILLIFKLIDSKLTQEHFGSEIERLRQSEKNAAKMMGLMSNELSQEVLLRLAASAKNKGSIVKISENKIQIDGYVFTLSGNSRIVNIIN